ncbi:MAG: AbrB/MazE/SpoVT family DNA-binding domain-containing protein [Chloroflexi bacterium]|nr:AbrB/MazE/SpoVT family DNA-binding domain-containing protein [Chloroflexota bacterium]
MIVCVVSSVTDYAEVRVGPQGRVVIPAALRRSVGIDAGDRLITRAEDGRLIFEKREAILARVRARFKGVPPEVSLANELIEERRVEAAREAEA